MEPWRVVAITYTWLVCGALCGALMGRLGVRVESVSHPLRVEIEPSDGGPVD